MIANGDQLITIGEDQVVHQFGVVGGRRLKLDSSKQYEKLISLLFVINGTPYISFYETPTIVKIWWPKY